MSKMPKTPFSPYFSQIISLTSLPLAVTGWLMTKCIALAVSVRMLSTVINKISTKMIIKHIEMLTEETFQRKYKLPRWLMHKFNNVLKSAGSLCLHSVVHSVSLILLLGIFVAVWKLSGAPGLWASSPKYTRGESLASHTFLRSLHLVDSHWRKLDHMTIYSWINY